MISSPEHWVMGFLHAGAAVICVQAVEPHELDVLRLVRSHGLERHIVR